MKEKKQIIENSLVNLMDEYRFREITIKMLCTEANINRSTFYAYYLDKYDLLDSMIDFHIENIINMVKTKTEGITNAQNKQIYVKNYINALFQYIYENQRFFKILITKHPAQNFTQKLIGSLRQSYSEIINQFHLKNPDYFVNYTIGGQFGVLFFWLQQDCKEHPCEISDIVFNNILKTNR
ncbi:TetR/AcrR family transcriptional regulator [Macrococcus sp. DPC7161]|uniref:TetR/AcrR family transcriptional regulator n=1 Tax=Macrococcus sp. DPC7161 TaxID=2507060 RepID=UPI00100A5534|nr:TetR-like C-terminal domain-containing protein [Macrococcus sp. DPC7161]RXK17950.1 TetR/AcrR family transcriptional regulator [Macrococcus sp. DPC7161]